MKLVFVTRKVDRGDALTGFVFGWIEKLAKNLDKLYVICQEKGDTSGLPENVEVYSFGKDKGYGRLRQGFRLLVLSFKLGKNSNGFFVHMHPIYAIVAWIPAKFLGKRMILWYTHKSVDFKLRIAHALVDEVLTASQESFRLPSNKVRVVGHGIDLGKFTPLPQSLPTSGGGNGTPQKISDFLGTPKVGGSKFLIISIGRISPVKDYETLIKAVEILRDQGVRGLDVEIYGRVGLPAHQAYLDSLISFVHNADLEDIVKFQGEVNYEYVQEVYQEADLFVNLSQTGSIDKSVLEAAACGTMVLTSNEAFAASIKNIFHLLFFERNNPRDLAEKILQIKNLSDPDKHLLEGKLRVWVSREHNLDVLAKKIVAQFQ